MAAPMTSGPIPSAGIEAIEYLLLAWGVIAMMSVLGALRPVLIFGMVLAGGKDSNKSRWSVYPKNTNKIVTGKPGAK